MKTLLEPCESLDAVKLASLRPVVRYVDADLAVVDLKLTLTQTPPTHPRTNKPARVELLVEVRSTDSFVDTQQLPLSLRGVAGSARLEIVQPLRWWPANMGDQPLHDLEVGLLINDELTDLRSISIGLTSVRQLQSTSNAPSTDAMLVVNGKPCSFSAIVPVDEVNQQKLLPVAGDALLLVRDHYGPDILYNAADRAGILMVQSVPIHPQGHPEWDVDAQVDRLTMHPSLAGWFVGHLGRVSDTMAQTLRELDPTHQVFRELPSLS
ncbi:MAG: hypothetical protein HC898_10135 [Phycisphaerales bacterium]|nr:hypothetical protein [Phycisphaerales bacterium]